MYFYSFFHSVLIPELRIFAHFFLCALSPSLSPSESSSRQTEDSHHQQAPSNHQSSFIFEIISFLDPSQLNEKSYPSVTRLIPPTSTRINQNVSQDIPQHGSERTNSSRKNRRPLTHSRARFRRCPRTAKGWKSGHDRPASSEKGRWCDL